MAKPRRMGTETSETRARIIDVTEKIMLDDGYAAVSSRRVAGDAGITPALVHYYFGTLDALFLAVLRRRADQQLERQMRMLSSTPEPLRAMWDAIKDPSRTGLILEFMALANHRKSIASELATLSERFREAQLGQLRDYIERSTIDTAAIPPVAVLVLLNAVAQNIVLEQSIGMKLGHAETLHAVEQIIDGIEHPAPTTPGRRRIKT